MFWRHTQNYRESSHLLDAPNWFIQAIYSYLKAIFIIFSLWPKARNIFYISANYTCIYMPIHKSETNSPTLYFLSFPIKNEKCHPAHYTDFTIHCCIVNLQLEIHRYKKQLPTFLFNPVPFTKQRITFPSNNISHYKPWLGGWEWHVVWDGISGSETSSIMPSPMALFSQVTISQRTIHLQINSFSVAVAYKYIYMQNGHSYLASKPDSKVINAFLL